MLSRLNIEITVSWFVYFLQLAALALETVDGNIVTTQSIEESLENIEDSRQKVIFSFSHHVSLEIA